MGPDAKIYALIFGGVAFAMVLDDIFEWCYLHYGWEWCLHGGALGEIQKEEREEYLEKVWCFRD